MCPLVVWYKCHHPLPPDARTRTLTHGHLSWVLVWTTPDLRLAFPASPLALREILEILRLQSASSRKLFVTLTLRKLLLDLHVSLVPGALGITHSVPCM